MLQFVLNNEIINYTLTFNGNHVVVKYHMHIFLNCQCACFDIKQIILFSNGAYLLHAINKWLC